MNLLPVALQGGALGEGARALVALVGPVGGGGVRVEVTRQVGALAEGHRTGLALVGPLAGVHRPHVLRQVGGVREGLRADGADERSGRRPCLIGGGDGGDVHLFRSCTLRRVHLHKDGHYGVCFRTTRYWFGLYWDATFAASDQFRFSYRWFGAVDQFCRVSGVPVDVFGQVVQCGEGFRAEHARIGNRLLDHSFGLRSIDFHLFIC